MPTIRSLCPQSRAIAPKSNFSASPSCSSEPITEAATQVVREIAIDLDGVQARKLLQQQCRQRAGARPDLHHRVGGCWIYRIGDALQHRLVMQEMLAEPLARLDHERLAASLAASCTAASRLPASARPVPARSSAVP